MKKELKSPTFSVGADDESTWYLKLCPGGCELENKDSVSLFLYRVALNKTGARAKFSLSILDANFEAAYVRSVEQCHFFPDGGSFGFREFIKRDFLLDKVNAFLPCDKLTLCCKVSRQDFYLSQLQEKLSFLV